MYVFDYMIYHLRPYGISYNVEPLEDIDSIHDAYSHQVEGSYITTSKKTNITSDSEDPS